MVQIITQQIEGVNCPKCGSALKFNDDYVFRARERAAYISLKCATCNRDNFVLTISLIDPNPYAFARKKTYHEGVRADYEDCYSFMRKFTEMGRRFTGPSQAVKHLRVDHRIARAAFRSLNERDRLEPETFIIRATTEIENLPF